MSASVEQLALVRDGTNTTSAPKRAQKANRGKSGLADQFCVYRRSYGQNTPALAIEYKAPRKLTREEVVQDYEEKSNQHLPSAADEPNFRRIGVIARTMHARDLWDIKYNDTVVAMLLEFAVAWFAQRSHRQLPRTHVLAPAPLDHQISTGDSRLTHNFQYAACPRLLEYLPA
ncbi:hypothetical protein F5Y17DRAFT_464036 [Xylariaceae sp. FL0594]|nr:hypothetical protein F5Y17DRAFT_464036 [Xylariaceae sp. FL0594]